VHDDAVVYETGPSEEGDDCVVKVSSLRLCVCVF
jgi:hypothetical protein